MWVSILSLPSILIMSSLHELISNKQIPPTEAKSISKKLQGPEFIQGPHLRDEKKQYTGGKVRL